MIDGRLPELRLLVIVRKASVRSGHVFPRREGDENKGKQKKRPTFTKTAWIPAIVFPPGPTGIPPVPAVCTKIFFSLNI